MSSNRLFFVLIFTPISLSPSRLGRFLFGSPHSTSRHFDGSTVLGSLYWACRMPFLHSLVYPPDLPSRTPLFLAFYQSRKLRNCPFCLCLIIEERSFSSLHTHTIWLVSFLSPPMRQSGKSVACSWVSDTEIWPSWEKANKMLRNTANFMRDSFA